MQGLRVSRASDTDQFLFYVTVFALALDLTCKNINSLIWLKGLGSKEN
jgi:hypothetical protein